MGLGIEIATANDIVSGIVDACDFADGLVLGVPIRPLKSRSVNTEICCNDAKG